MGDSDRIADAASSRPHANPYSPTTTGNGEIAGPSTRGGTRSFKQERSCGPRATFLRFVHWARDLVNRVAAALSGCPRWGSSRTGADETTSPLSSAPSLPAPLPQQDLIPDTLEPAQPASQLPTLPPDELAAQLRSLPRDGLAAQLTSKSVEELVSLYQFSLLPADTACDYPPDKPPVKKGFQRLKIAVEREFERRLEEELLTVARTVIGRKAPLQGELAAIQTNLANKAADAGIKRFTANRLDLNDRFARCFSNCLLSMSSDEILEQLKFRPIDELVSLYRVDGPSSRNAGSDPLPDIKPAVEREFQRRLDEELVAAIRIALGGLPPDDGSSSSDDPMPSRALEPLQERLASIRTTLTDKAAAAGIKRFAPEKLKDEVARCFRSCMQDEVAAAIEREVAATERAKQPKTANEPDRTGVQWTGEALRLAHKFARLGKVAWPDSTRIVTDLKELPSAAEQRAPRGSANAFSSVEVLLVALAKVPTGRRVSFLEIFADRNKLQNGVSDLQKLEDGLTDLQKLNEGITGLSDSDKLPVGFSIPRLREDIEQTINRQIDEFIKPIISGLPWVGSQAGRSASTAANLSTAQQVSEAVHGIDQMLQKLQGSTVNPLLQGQSARERVQAHWDEWIRTQVQSRVNAEAQPKDKAAVKGRPGAGKTPTGERPQPNRDAPAGRLASVIENIKTQVNLAVQFGILETTMYVADQAVGRVLLRSLCQQPLLECAQLLASLDDTSLGWLYRCADASVPGLEPAERPAVTPGQLRNAIKDLMNERIRSDIDAGLEQMKSATESDPQDEAGLPDGGRSTPAPLERARLTLARCVVHGIIKERDSEEEAGGPALLLARELARRTSERLDTAAPTGNKVAKRGQQGLLSPASRGRGTQWRELSVTNLQRLHTQFSSLPPNLETDSLLAHIERELTARGPAATPGPVDAGEKNKEAAFLRGKVDHVQNMPRHGPAAHAPLGMRPPLTPNTATRKMLESALDLRSENNNAAVQQLLGSALELSRTAATQAQNKAEQVRKLLQRIARYPRDVVLAHLDELPLHDLTALLGYMSSEHLQELCAEGEGVSIPANVQRAMSHEGINEVIDTKIDTALEQLFFAAGTPNDPNAVSTAVQQLREELAPMTQFAARRGLTAAADPVAKRIERGFTLKLERLIHRTIRELRLPTFGHPASREEAAAKIFTEMYKLLEHTGELVAVAAKTGVAPSMQTVPGGLPKSGAVLICKALDQLFINTPLFKTLLRIKEFLSYVATEELEMLDQANTGTPELKAAIQTALRNAKANIRPALYSGPIIVE
jgi:hypothetical protein